MRPNKFTVSARSPAPQTPRPAAGRPAFAMPHKMHSTAGGLPLGSASICFLIHLVPELALQPGRYHVSHPVPYLLIPVCRPGICDTVTHPLPVRQGARLSMPFGLCPPEGQPDERNDFGPAAFHALIPRSAGRPCCACPPPVLPKSGGSPARAPSAGFSQSFCLCCRKGRRCR